MNLIATARELAYKIHENEKRKYSDSPAISHQCRVAGEVMARKDSTAEMVATAYLHDSNEDHPDVISIKDIEDIFGSKVAAMVDWMTNKSKETGKKRSERKMLDRIRLRGAPTEVKIIKLLDRIDNINDIPAKEKFTELYCKESFLLAETLRDADENLYQKLVLAIKQKLKECEYENHAEYSKQDTNQRD